MKKDTQNRPQASEEPLDQAATQTEPLLTTVEIVCPPPPPPDPTPQTTEYIREARRTEGGTKKNWSQALTIDGRQPVMNDLKLVTTCILEYASLALPAGVELCSQDELAKLRELQEQMDRIIERQAKFSPSRASDKFNADRQRMRDAAHSGNIEEIPHVHTRDSINEDFRVRRMALETQLITITHRDVVPVAKAILERFATVIETCLRSVEEQDRSQAEGCGFEYHPSVFWKVVIAVDMKFVGWHRLPIPQAYSSPRAILEDLVAI